ncbi:unnamed protein product [Gadus morhua 'NCC']
MSWSDGGDPTPCGGRPDGEGRFLSPGEVLRGQASRCHGEVLGDSVPVCQRRVSAVQEVVREEGGFGKVEDEPIGAEKD